MSILDIIFGCMAICGVVWGIYSHFHLKKKLKDIRISRTRYTWDDVRVGVEIICNYLKHESFIPDAFLCLPGAGLIVTELALIKLNEFIPVYICLQTEREKLTPPELAYQLKIQTSKWNYWIPEEIYQLKNKKIVIFDDYAQTGTSLDETKKALIIKKVDPANIRTIALIAIKSLMTDNPQLAPDKVAYWVDDYDVLMPWGHASKPVRIGKSLYK